MFCVKKNGKKYCVNKAPKMSAEDIVRIQMEAMKKNYRSSGIRSAYRYASPENRMNTGPFFEFKNMVLGNTYHHLLNCKSFIIKNKKYSKNDLNFSCLVEVQSNKDNKFYIYEFKLSRQFDYLNNMPLFDEHTGFDLKLYWRTNSVMLKGEKIFENFKFENFNNITKNVLGKPIKMCSASPMTGYFRDGVCNTDETDSGTHVVCAKMTKKFLEYTKKKGNNLSTPNPQYNFPGLKPGDKWCLCALRWKQALDGKVAPMVDLEATHKKALDYVNMDMLEKNKLL